MKPAVPLSRQKVLTIVAALVILIPAFLEAAAWVLSGTRWTEKDEKIYQQFVAAMGHSKYGNLNRFIRDPQANPLFGEEDKKFNLSPDCADLPYLLRAYVAYKLRLPFSYVSAISSKGGDQRYSSGNKPTGFRDQDHFSTPQQLFNQVTLVNSGYYRMATEIQNGDTYPVKIDPNSIVPGTIYYDPNGHVAVVFEVTPEGRIRFIDAHPDRSISRPWYGSKFERGSAGKGGGFRNWRPIWYSSTGQTNRLENVNIPFFSATDQYQKSFQAFGRAGLEYHDYVRLKLSRKGGKVNPVADFRQLLVEIHEDLFYRVEAVDICLRHGIHRKAHPGNLPWNIFGTDGEWETYSTPSRDARLKVAFLDLLRQTQGMIAMAERRDPNLEFSGTPSDLAGELIRIYDLHSPVLGITYQNSRGTPIRLSFNDVLKRLFRLSFDPYHAPELRWGAEGAEAASSPDGEVKQRLYERERRLRHQLERVYNTPTPLALGPENPPDIDVRSWLASYLRGSTQSHPQRLAGYLPTAIPLQASDQVPPIHPGITKNPLAPFSPEPDSPSPTPTPAHTPAPTHASPASRPPVPAALALAETPASPKTSPQPGPQPQQLKASVSPVTTSAPDIHRQYLEFMQKTIQGTGLLAKKTLTWHEQSFGIQETKPSANPALVR